MTRMIARKGSKSRLVGMSQAKGFTLVEIMIVLAVLAVMAAVVIPNISGFLGRGKERAFEADQRLLQAAVDAWRTDVANRVGNPWPTVNAVRGTPADNTSPADGDYVDYIVGAGQPSADVNSFIKLTDLTGGNYIKGVDVVKSYKYAPATTLGATGVPSTSIGSYLWYIDTNGLVLAYRWDDANGNSLVNAGELTAGYVTDVYP